MAKGDKSDYRAMTFRLPPELLDRLEAWQKRTGGIKGYAVERALTEWLDREDGKKQG